MLTARGTVTFDASLADYSGSVTEKYAKSKGGDSPSELFLIVEHLIDRFKSGFRAA